MLSHSRLQTIILTSDIAEAERFYTELLGLKLRRRSNGNLVFDVGGADLTVGAVPAIRASGHTVMGFAVRNLEAEMNELGRRGITWERFEGFDHDERGVVITPDGDRVAWFRDPAGNIISVVQFSK